MLKEKLSVRDQEAEDLRDDNEKLTAALAQVRNVGV
jgi:hypothetical protein